MGEIEKAPEARDRDIPRRSVLSAEPRTVRVIGAAELRALFDYGKESPCGCVLELLFALGMRLDLILGLRVCDIDRDGLTLSLREEDGTVSARLPPNLFPRLEKLMEGKSPPEFVFSAQQPAVRPLSVRTVQKFLSRAALELRLSKISIQGLRDNFAVYSLRLGGDPGLLMSQMGYRHRRSFRRLLSAVPPDQRRFPSPLDRLRLL